MVPATHVPLPLHPVPPHCVYCARVPVEEVEDDVGAAALVEVARVVGAAVVVGADPVTEPRILKSTPRS